MPFQYLLDTNICIYIIKKKPISVINRFEKLSRGALALSVITYGELLYGIQKSQQAKKALSILDEFIKLIPPLPVPIIAGHHYGEIRAKLEKEGRLIGNNDLWIAAHTLSLDITLVTNNVTEFERVPGLKLENWI